MRPLPNQRYEAAVWNPNIKVGVDYLVSDGRNKYFVPFDLIDAKVDIRVTSQTVKVFFHGNRMASHIRQAVAQRDPIMNPDHITPEHRKYLKLQPRGFHNMGNLGWPEYRQDCCPLSNRRVRA